MSDVLDGGVPCLMSRVQGAGPGGSMSDAGGRGGLYSEVQCIMGNGRMGSPLPPVNRLTDTSENIPFPQLP